MVYVHKNKVGSTTLASGLNICFGTWSFTV